MPGWGSWDWVGEAFLEGLRDEFETASFAPWAVPDAAVVVVVKHAPPPEWAAEVARRSALVYCPIDFYGSPVEIAADADWLRHCGRVVVHARRLEGYFRPLAETVYLDHPLKYALPTRPASRSDGPILWVGVRTNLPPLVEWVNAHPLPAPLDVLTNPERAGEVPPPAAFGFRPDRDVRVHEWTPERHLALLARARVALDIKGNDFRSRHKPPAKVLDFVASGVPVALTPGSAAEHLAGLGLAAPSPLDADRWLSAEYADQTRRLGEALTQTLSAGRVAATARTVVAAALAGWTAARPAGAAVSPPAPAGPPAPRVYGLMITKDDHPVFADWCRDQLPLYDAVVCLDGSDGDETARIARGYADRLVYLRERDFAIPHKTDHGLRRVVHEEIVRRYGPGHWVMCCHPDEFCYHDPRKVAARADRDGFDQVGWFSPHFYPHPEDLADWDRRRGVPVPDRFRHYHWSYRGDGLPWVEDRLYRAGPGSPGTTGRTGASAPTGSPARPPTARPSGTSRFSSPTPGGTT
jgi:hypothetical protein